MTQRAEAEVPDPSVGKYRPGQEPVASIDTAPAAQKEFGGRRDGSEPTRFGDWEKQGRCIDF